MEELADAARRGDDRRPLDRLARVDIDDDPVRLLDARVPGIPGVHLQHAHLHEADERLDRVGNQILTDLGLFLNAHAPDGYRRPHLRMLHVEAAGIARTAAARAIRTADQRQRPIDQMRNDPIGDCLVVASELELGCADGGEDDPVRMRDPDARDQRPIGGRTGTDRATGVGTKHARDGAVNMPDNPQRRVALELPWRTVFKVLAAVALVWCWLHLVSLILLMTVAVLLAVTLDPIVQRLEARGLPRWGGSTLVVFGLIAIIAAVTVFAITQLSGQARIVGTC